MADKIKDFSGNAKDNPAAHHVMAFHCPGCGYDHAFTVNGPPNRPSWSWNGSYDKPVFRPSLLCNQSVPTSRCHSFVGGISGDKPGMIEFLGDCFHALKNKTVELPDFNEEIPAVLSASQPGK